MTAGSCRGCHEDAKRKIQKKEMQFSEEDYERMGEL